jgi:apoptosis-inducing factor 3
VEAETVMSDRDLMQGVPAVELTEGTMIAGTIDGEQAVMIRHSDTVYAIGGTCTHYGAPLADGAIIEGAIRCPWHHACFDLRTGAVMRAPALAPLPCWSVEKRGERYVPGDRLQPSRPAGSNGPARVVIVGAGAAGVNVADALRAEGYNGRIVMISRDEELPYDKPNLSKDFLAGQAPAEWLPLHPRDYYETQRIELRLGVTVSSIDTTTKVNVCRSMRWFSPPEHQFAG